MAIKIQKMVNITNDTLWFHAAPPKGKEKQWKDSYSAKELAKFATDKSGLFNKFITNLVKTEFGHNTSASFVGEPERDTYLPPTKKGPRNHDLFLWNKDIAIGIEAKVNAPYGDSIVDEYKKATKENREDMIARIEWLLKIIVPGSSIEDSKISGLKYQLFTATAGTLLEAYERGLTKCIVLVLSFREQSMEKNVRNDNDFYSFVKNICNESSPYRKRFRIEGKEIDCLFIKQEVITNNYSLM